MALKFLKDLGLSKPSWLPKFSAESSEVRRRTFRHAHCALVKCAEKKMLRLFLT